MEMSVHARVDRKPGRRVNSNVVRVHPSAANGARLLEGDRVESVKSVSQVAQRYKAGCSRSDHGHVQSSLVRRHRSIQVPLYRYRLYCATNVASKHENKSLVALYRFVTFFRPKYVAKYFKSFTA